MSSFFRQDPSPRRPSTRAVSGIIFEDPEEHSENGGDSVPISRTASVSIPEGEAKRKLNNAAKEERVFVDGLWKQIIDPALEYCQVRPNVLVNVLTCSIMLALDFYQEFAGPRSTSNSALDHDKTQRKCVSRGRKARMQSTRNISPWPATRYVAIIPEGYGRTSREPQKTR